MGYRRNDPGLESAVSGRENGCPAGGTVICEERSLEESGQNSPEDTGGVSGKETFGGKDEEIIVSGRQYYRLLAYLGG